MRVANLNITIQTGIMFVLAVFTLSCNMGSKQEIVSKNHISEADAVTLLQENMRTQKEWIKVHAAEFLLWSGYSEGVKDLFLEEEKYFGTQSPYRIGIWRVLVQAETVPARKQIWIDKIIRAFHDENGRDRLHAMETLAKLKVPVFDNSPKLGDILSVDTLDSFDVYKLWNFAYSSEENFQIARDTLIELLISEIQPSQVRTLSAYSLKKMGDMDEASWRLLTERALSDSPDLSVQINILSMLVVTANQKMVQTELYGRLNKEILLLNEKEDAHHIKMSLLDTLAEKGDNTDLELLYSIFNTIKTAEDAITIDLLSSCAYAIVMIEKRNKNLKSVKW